MYFFLPSLLHSLIQCFFFSVFHPSFTFPKHWRYHLDRIVWGFLSLSFFLFAYWTLCSYQQTRAQCLVWWKGISQPVVATLSALLPPLSLLLPLLPLFLSCLFLLYSFLSPFPCEGNFKNISGQWDASFLYTCMHWSLLSCNQMHLFLTGQICLKSSFHCQNKIKTIDVFISAAHFISFLLFT